MKIHEYQAKAILSRYAISVPAGIACFSVEEAILAAEKLGGDKWVVKAQIYAGGRGKAGGVKLAKSIVEVRQFSEAMLFAPLVTHQTGPQGQIVRRLYIEQGIDISHEYYVALVVDRASQCVSLIASDAGGMDIEGVATSTPEKIHKTQINPLEGLNLQDAERVVRQINLPESCRSAAVSMLGALYQAFDENDISLLEINPLIVTPDNRLIALDAKMNFDDNALFRHPEIVALRDLDEDDPLEVEAARHGLSYIPLDGDIGCLVNGAGLAMATMDIIKLYGGNPANFLDVGGGATVEKVTEAFKLMLRNPDLQAILVNIFGGIMRCDVIADGVVSAVREVKLAVPLIVRLEGTNVELGKKILADSGLTIIAGSNMADAARKAVDAAARHRSEAATRGA
ncbi:MULTISPECIES: ADP-forming succinate--CoA ligase subunit beta [Nitrosomonas]|uniref:Succinate--CoA ligase [ADP-forming] subunit beta n=2 Tax=Nitrosomonas eutropha TaxID=916 RepID=A0ABX5MB47_9PROT|nr:MULTISPECIES: ADP-forming succinate--CoA ligase subunit beta [Nitrosomonas]ABI58505.1 succinyl-CoA synthetase (ADP-forming) beta subunit [Nitrosomonas eutropha C91]MXS81002.1 ADP-forming succinate--CoA ligase subunit beta [Nitrosomonas sp. GH22]PXV82299.1 succinyl-CoA synthetase (ADP-forming) beta subunit [Nitrosomonas eutropha]SDW13295.1 succinyl-CoA synthetase (ADP-forming) beta subunit [Nitrosomonas eutropha]SEI69506.1 succinyl-CoA synthetase (ADP-forming) beta subunit [Nitrosomonas eutr